MKNLSWGGPGACGGPKSWTSDRIYSENRRETIKGEHSVLFVSSFLLRKAEAPYQKKTSISSCLLFLFCSEKWRHSTHKKGENFVLCLKHIWCPNRGDGTSKKTSISCCFQNIFGESFGGTVQILALPIRRANRRPS